MSIASLVTFVCSGCVAAMFTSLSLSTIWGILISLMGVNTETEPAPMWEGFEFDEVSREEFVAMVLQPEDDAVDAEWETEVQDYLNFVSPPAFDELMESPVIECPENTTPEEDLLAEWELCTFDWFHCLPVEELEVLRSAFLGREFRFDDGNHIAYWRSQLD